MHSAVSISSHLLGSKGQREVVSTRASAVEQMSRLFLLPQKIRKILCGDRWSDYVTLIRKAMVNISMVVVKWCACSCSQWETFCVSGHLAFLWKWDQKKNSKQTNTTVSVTGCFTIPFPCFPFCHFSIILGISVRQALFLKLPLFHRFLYFMISTSSSSVVQTEVEAWGNQAATMTWKPHSGTCKISQFS